MDTTQIRHHTGLLQANARLNAPQDHPVTRAALNPQTPLPSWIIITNAIKGKG
ncbi:MAG: hypothetical protein HQM04_04760 [Magnetococcales bacterium]|nr:hypothetical protein [Magnetococcales bacterium]MBF0114336.1 hypothetical protein [Magnetococcales bacterium]